MAGSVPHRAIERRLGIQDPRSTQGIMAAGAPVYRGGLGNAHSGGGPQFGRPPVAGTNGMQPEAEGIPQGQSDATLTTLMGSFPNSAVSQPTGLDPAKLNLLLARIRQPGGPMYGRD